MGEPEESTTARPSSKSSNEESTQSTLAPSGVPVMSEKAAAAADPAVNETSVTSKLSTDAAVAELEKEKDVGVAAGDESSDAEEEEEEDNTVYPGMFKLTLITIALCLAVFCMALDNTIISVAIPRITDQFKALNDVGWYASAYLLTQCAFQLLFGKIYTFYSIKWTFLSAICIFEIGSLICGVAPNSTTLIVGRAIAGLGGAGLFSGALLIVAYCVPLRQRPTYMGMVGSMYGIASVAGPLMGGAFTDKLTWRWCFFINLPFGAVTCIFIFFFFQSPPRARRSETDWKGQIDVMDPYGTAVFLGGVISLLLALQWGGSKYAWSNGRIVALLIIFGLCAIGFVSIQMYKKERATVPPRIFKNRNVYGGAFFSAMLGGSFFTLVYFLPIWFQAIKGVSAVKSGIMNLPLILGTVIMSMVAGGATTAIGYYTPFMYLATIMLSVGAGLMTTFQTNTGHAKWIGYQFIFGAGVGLGMQAPMVATQTVLPKSDIAIGTSLMMFSNTLGGSLFASVGQNIFTNRLVAGLRQQVPGLEPGFVLSVGATEIKNRLPKELLPKILVAYNDALTNTWYIAVALGSLSAIGAALMQWKSVKGKKVSPAVA